MFTMLIPGNLPVERMPRNVPSNMQGHLHGLCVHARGGYRASRKKLVFDGVCALNSNAAAILR